jgi:peptide/nickel transport system substrate-binding protein
MITRRDLGKITAGGLLAASLPARAQAQTRPNLTIAVDNLWQSMEPIFGISTTGQRIMPNFYDVLIERDFINDPNGLILEPKLATKWEQNGKVWTLQLREGVKFHNGAEMTAEDVAFTLSAERLWGEKPIAPRGKTFTSNFRRVAATGRYTVEIETAAPDPNIPGKLTGYIGFVVPKAHYLELGHEKFGQAPIGTGPYRVTTFRSGEVMVLEAFDEYWGGKPPAQKLTWRIVPEFAARLAGLVSGEFDFIVNIPTDQTEVIRGYDHVNYVSKPADNYPAFAFNTRADPADNPLVDENLRYAMVQGVNMDEIVKALFGEETFHPTVPFNFPEYGKFYDPNMKPRLTYDPAKAKELVKKSKYNGEPLRWHITRSFYPNYEAAAEIMVEQWREIGVNVQPIVLDSFELVYRRPFHLMNMSMSSDFIPGDPYQPLWLDWGPTASRSSASWKTWDPTPKFVELGKAFEAATDFEERKRLYLALSEEWQRVTPGFYLWKSVYNWAHRDGIEFVPVSRAEMRMYGGYLKIKS